MACGWGSEAGCLLVGYRGLMNSVDRGLLTAACMLLKGQMDGLF